MSEPSSAPTTIPDSYSSRFAQRRLGNVQESEASFWTLEELDFELDLAHWDKLTEDERNFAAC